MFSGFNLSDSNSNLDLLAQYYESGKAHFNQHKRDVETNLEAFICTDGSLKGTEMQKDWFPEVRADIFLSHSHKDEEKVIALAGWLHEKFGLQVFVDSCIWGYAPHLLKILDDKYCVSKRDGECTTYDYGKRNYSTSHVYMMLSMALTKMIDKTECLFFYNTPSSLTAEESINQGSTKSPWIYHELQTSKLLRHRPLSDYRDCREWRIDKAEREAILEYAQLSIKYDVTVEHLMDIKTDTLEQWADAYLKTPCRYALDTLYGQLGIGAMTTYGE